MFKFMNDVNFGNFHTTIEKFPLPTPPPGVLYFPTHALVVTGQALTISIQTVTDTTAKSVAWYLNDVELNPSESAYTITTVSVLSVC